RGTGRGASTDGRPPDKDRRPLRRPRQVRRAVPAVRRGPSSGELRVARGHVLPHVPDGGEGPGGPADVASHPMSLLARLRAHVVDLTPLRVSRDFRLLFLGKSVSDFGDEIVAVAVPFQVYVITHSTLAVGLLGLCQLVPVFVFPIVGGAVADAVERRGLMLTTHVLLALMSLLMAFNATLAHPR